MKLDRLGCFSTTVTTVNMLLWWLCSWPAVVRSTGLGKHFRHVDVYNEHRYLAKKQSQTFKGNEEKGEINWDVQELYLEQRLDHFAPAQGRSFPQRYFYSDRYVDTFLEIQLAFLCVGGEGPPMDASVLTDSVHCSGDMLELADRLFRSGKSSIHLFGLEHRYYGKSYPEFYNDKNESVSPVTNENLVYHSSRQALSDLAHFVKQMTQQQPSEKIDDESISRTNSHQHLRNSASKMTTSSPVGALPATAKWVTFGGSYPGMLAAWARSKFPFLIHAAVSNSAPIQAQLEMASYNDGVAFSLSYPKVGGSKQCLEVFTKGHAQLIDLVEHHTAGNATLREEIADAFNLCNASSLLERDNLQDFMGDGVATVMAQSNNPACQGDLCNIDRMCTFAMEQVANRALEWKVLGAIARQQQHTYRPGECLDIDWKSTLDYYASPESRAVRSWLWQTCNEFGFYQTCDDDKCPFAKGYHPLSEDLEICRVAFGVGADEIKTNIQQTHEYYGDRSLAGASRIVSVNGNVDPWSTLARTNNTAHDPLLPTHWVMGASHHFWTHPSQDTDTPEVQQARTFIQTTIIDWLGVHTEDESDYQQAQIN